MKNALRLTVLLATACSHPNPPAAGGGPSAMAPNPLAGAAAVEQPTSFSALRARTLRSTAPALANDVPQYTLSLDLRWGLFTYGGTEALRYINTERDTLTELNFLLYPNSPGLAEPGTKQLLVSDVRVDGDVVKAEATGDRLRVPLASPLAPGQAVQVDLRFEGAIVRLDPNANDLGKQAVAQVMQMVMGDSETKGGFGVFAYGDRIVSLGLWYPILASYDERGWDLDRNGGVGDVSYFDVADYQVSVSTPSTVQLATTGVELASAVEGERRTTRFGAAGVREFTIEASEHFKSASAEVNGVTLRSWYLDGEEEAGKRVLSYATEAFRTYERRFGPYPYTELDVVEAPLVGGAGGVEFPGLVTIGRMFYAADTPPPGDLLAEGLAKSKYLRDTLEFVVAHEVAHEWWNATVGSDSKRHPFVDEALANHSAILYFEEVHGKAAANEQIALQLKLPYQLARLVGANDRPVDLPTADFAGMMEYAAVVYGKGALFFEAARQQMGDDAYTAFLRKHYAEYGFKVASADSLIAGLVEAAPDAKAMLALVNRWLEGTHGDADIGPMDVAQVLRSVLGGDIMGGELGRIVGVLGSKGAGELGKLAKQLISPDGQAKEAIDWGAVLSLAQEVVGEEDGSILGVAARVLRQNPEALREGGDPTVLAKAALKELANGDPGTLAAIEAADAVYRIVTALNGDNEDEGQDESDE